MSPPSPHFDLTSTLDLQKNYILDLTDIPIDSNLNKSSENAVIDLNAKLSKLQTSYAGSNLASGALLTDQKKVNEILTTENDRLNQKKQNIDTAVSGQRRAVFLNMNYQKRYGVYTKMAITLTIGLVIYLLLQRFREAFPIIPDIIYQFLIVVDFAVVLVVLMIFYFTLSTRELTNYDEIVLPPPDLSKSSAPGSNDKSTDRSTDESTDKSSELACVGAACCGNDTYGNPIPWDGALNQCSYADSDMTITSLF